MPRIPNERGPLGQKPPKAEKAKRGGISRASSWPEKPRKALKPVSKKKAARKAAEAAMGAREHMAAVARLPCLVCGCYGVEVHHEGFPRSDFNVLPLCPRHHRREFGEGARHYSPQAFFALHGSPQFLLDKVAKMLRDYVAGD